MTPDRRIADVPVAVERRNSIAEQVESAVAKQELFATCFFCQLSNAQTCELGLSSCPWRSDRGLDDASIEAELTGQACPTDLILYG